MADSFSARDPQAARSAQTPSLPDRQISDDQLQAYRDFYVELLGFVPPRIQARTDLLARLDPELLTLQEELRRHCMYPRVFDVKTTQLMLFGMLLMNLQDAARLHAIAAQAAPTLLQKTAQWRVLLSDSFDKIGNDWTVDSYSSSIGKVSHAIAGGKYIWTLRADRPLANRDIPSVNAGPDYAVGVEGRRVSGPNTCGYGVSLRDDYHSFYLMVVNDDQTWRFGRAETYAPLTALAQGVSNTIRSGEVNRVQVIAQGETYTLFVNGTFVGQVNDAALKGNSLGIGVELVTKGDVCVRVRQL